MKYIIEYSLSFGSKICETCSGTGMITILTADSYVRRPCSNNSCFHDKDVYTESRFKIDGRRTFTSEHALTNFCERLYKIKMCLAFHYIGEVFRGLPSAYTLYRKGGYIEDKGYGRLSEVGMRVARVLPYHNKLKVEIYRKP